MHANGRFHVKFDDGDEDEQVAASHVILKPSSFSTGDRVVARFQGSEEFFDGVIGACHADQLYRVEFDDGDVDDGVHVSNILPRKLAA
mmetsp:Transcript_43242/g.136722  ORF Transcript_43242/g.136722 Transcript_43242/m.136722 type:complete len:88 (+) Transcript_43242:154-417(+)